MKYLNSFNEEQKQILIKEDSDKPNTLVIAGAGSGKTRSLIGIVEKALLVDKIKPEQIIVSTYTTKAAEEIKVRLGDLSKNLILGTIHSIARKIIIDSLNIPLRMIDEDDTLIIFASLCQDKNLMYKLPKLYSELKEVHRNLTLRELLIIRDISVEKESMVSKFFQFYENVKRKFNYFDFTDLMVYSLDLLKSPKTETFLKNIRLIIVDEVQDINDFQYDLFMSLNKYAQNMMMFGDDYQSIYGFRGSNSQLMKKFKSLPNVETKYLKSNYRSTDHIVRFCNEIILTGGEHTENLTIKECKSISSLKSTKKDILVSYHLNELEQAQAILEKLRLTVGPTVTQSDRQTVGVLSRTNKELKAFSTFLTLNNIQHVCHQNKKVQDTLHIALEKVSVDKEGKGDLNCYYWWIILGYYKAFEDKNVRKSLVFGKTPFWELINSNSLPNYTTQSDGISKEEFVEDMKKLYNDSTYIHVIQNKLQEKEIDYSDSDSESIEPQNIVLQTIHSSKGLEYDVVIILDCKVRPSDSYEEAIRLFYVACSRAKQKLYITHIGRSIPFIEKIKKSLFTIQKRD